MRIPLTYFQKCKVALHAFQAVLIFVIGCMSLSVIVTSSTDGRTGYCFALVCFLVDTVAGRKLTRCSVGSQVPCYYIRPWYPHGHELGGSPLRTPMLYLISSLPYAVISVCVIDTTNLTVARSSGSPLSSQWQHGTLPAYIRASKTRNPAMTRAPVRHSPTVLKLNAK